MSFNPYTDGAENTAQLERLAAENDRSGLATRAFNCRPENGSHVVESEPFVRAVIEDRNQMEFLR